MDIHDVALSLFAAAMQKPTGTREGRTNTATRVIAKQAYSEAALFMEEAMKHKPTAGKATVAPLKI